MEMERQEQDEIEEEIEQARRNLVETQRRQNRRTPESAINESRIRIGNTSFRQGILNLE